jgi:hypothetical protein
MPTIIPACVDCYSYHVHNPLRAGATAVRYCMCAAGKQTMPTIPSSCTSLFVPLHVHNLLRAVVLQQCAAACVHY